MKKETPLTDAIVSPALGAGYIRREYAEATERTLRAEIKELSASLESAEPIAIACACASKDMQIAQLRAQIAEMTKERSGFRKAFCNGPAYDTGETPEEALVRWMAQAYIGDVAAVIIAREAIKQRDELRAELAELKADKERLDWLQVEKPRQAYHYNGGFTAVNSEGICFDARLIRDAIDAAMEGVK